MRAWWRIYFIVYIDVSDSFCTNQQYFIIHTQLWGLSNYRYLQHITLDSNDFLLRFIVVLANDNYQMLTIIWVMCHRQFLFLQPHNSMMDWIKANVHIVVRLCVKTLRFRFYIFCCRFVFIFAFYPPTTLSAFDRVSQFCVCFLNIFQRNMFQQYSVFISNV